MAPIVLGLDLAAVRFGAFKTSRMADARWPLRARRLLAFQLAMVLTVIGESLATATLSKYLDLQTSIEHAVPGASLYQNDIIGVASYTIFAGVLTASILGALFFFLLFWPANRETRMWAAIKLALVSFCDTALLGACIASTIVAGTRSAHYEFMSGVDVAAATQSIRAAGLTRPPLVYRSYTDVPVWLAFLWAGWLATVWSNVLVWQASRFYLAHPDAQRVAEKAAPGSRAAHASGSEDGLQAA